MSDNVDRQRLRRQLGLEGPRTGTLYAVNGSITDETGRYYVRYQDRTTERLKAKGAFQALPGVAVLTQYDPISRTRMIIRQDLSADGGNSTYTGNPSDPRNQPPVTSRAIVDLLPRVVGTNTMTLTVGPLASRLQYLSDWYTFNGATIDLTANVPSTADTHRYAVVGYWPINGQLYALNSTPKDDEIELGSSDIDEAWEARTRNLVPVAAVALVAGQTALSPADIVPLRQIINVDPPLGYPDPVTDLLFIEAGYTVKVDSGLEIAAGGTITIGPGGTLSIGF